MNTRYSYSKTELKLLVQHCYRVLGEIPSATLKADTE